MSLPESIKELLSASEIDLRFVKKVPDNSQVTNPMIKAPLIDEETHLYIKTHKNLEYLIAASLIISASQGNLTAARLLIDTMDTTDGAIDEDDVSFIDDHEDMGIEKATQNYMQMLSNEAIVKALRKKPRKKKPVKKKDEDPK